MYENFDVDAVEFCSTMDWRQKLRELKIRLFPPVTRSSFLRHYVPKSGALSHTVFSMHIFAPQIIGNLFPTYDLAVSNMVLFNSHVGIGFYVFFRKHQIRLKMWDRIEFSVFASVLFNFGSLMFMVLLKALIPKRISTSFSVLIGASLSTFLVTRGIKYANQIDARTVIPINDAQKFHPKPLLHSQKQVNGHLPAIAEQKSSNGHLVTKIPTPVTPVKQAIQFVTPSSLPELRTSA